jgi:hypothetical protein
MVFPGAANKDSEPSQWPTEYVASTCPMAEEDDDFLSVGSETWDYEVADGREDDFIAALQNSQMVMEYVRLDD